MNIGLPKKTLTEEQAVTVLEKRMAYPNQETVSFKICCDDGDDCKCKKKKYSTLKITAYLVITPPKKAYSGLEVPWTFPNPRPPYDNQTVIVPCAFEGPIGNGYVINFGVATCQTNHRRLAMAASYRGELYGPSWDAIRGIVSEVEKKVFCYQNSDEGRHRLQGLVVESVGIASRAVALRNSLRNQGHILTLQRQMEDMEVHRDGTNRQLNLHSEHLIRHDNRLDQTNRQMVQTNRQVGQVRRDVGEVRRDMGHMYENFDGFTRQVNGIGDQLVQHGGQLVQYQHELAEARGQLNTLQSDFQDFRRMQQASQQAAHLQDAASVRSADPIPHNVSIDVGMSPFPMADVTNRTLPDGPPAPDDDGKKPAAVARDEEEEDAALSKEIVGGTELLDSKKPSVATSKNIDNDGGTKQPSVATSKDIDDHLGSKLLNSKHPSVGSEYEEDEDEDSDDITYPPSVSSMHNEDDKDSDDDLDPRSGFLADVEALSRGEMPQSLYEPKSYAKRKK